ncbi:hypothetical protein [Flaviflagellibacter deserti]|uniref:Uncharacterized protein n=1 Tax=Flaviflagellibacter deserti TaxID=2267266 RepID=A0ABV9Z1M7_9HYPH
MVSPDDLKSVDRILEATARGGRFKVPTDIDREGLASALSFCLTWYKMYASQAKKPERRRRKEVAAKIGSSAVELLGALSKAEQLRMVGIDQPDDAVLDFLHLLVDQAREAEDLYSSPGAFKDVGSAFVFLAGERLPHVYEKYLGHKATIGRGVETKKVRSPPANSPYIRFAIAFCDEFGVRPEEGRSYSGETIADALKKARRHASNQHGAKARKY